ncbi:MAG: outer membrane lipoprotein-sorting protein [Desulfuromonadaceae bacterium]|nr:outer membrane lipoprotein-sorting protein [Desulfuromonadaceae bacterium]
MSRLLILPVFLLVSLLMPTGLKAEESLPDLEALIRQVETQYNGLSSHAVARMDIQTRNWQRSLVMEFWSWRRDRFLTRILEPAREKGVSTLKLDNEVWNYLPKVDRVIKVPSSMMGGSWMGSHITNDDLVKSDRIDQLFDFTLAQENAEIYQIVCQPKPQTVTVWGQLVYTIDKQHLTPQQVDYFDEEGLLVRQIFFDQIRQIEGRSLPLRMTVVPHDKPEEQTVLTYEQLTFETELTESFFSLRQLKQR